LPCVKSEKIKMKSTKDEKFVWGGLHPFFYHPFIFHLIPDLKNKTVLDVGCGRGIYGYLIRATRPLAKGRLIGLDTNPDYLSFCSRFKVYDKLIKSDVRHLPFKDKSIDILLCTEVIEHLPKKEGKKFLNEINRVCRGRAIITTPNVFFKTVDAKFEDAHHSVWSADEFRQYGYKVHGIGVRMPIGSYDKTFMLKQALSFLATPISFIIPELSGYIICFKDY